MVFLAGPKSTVLGAIKLQLANIGTNLVWSTYKPESTWSEYEVRVPCFGIEFILKNANGIHWTASESGFCGGPTRIDKKPVAGHHLKLYQTLALYYRKHLTLCSEIFQPAQDYKPIKANFWSRMILIYQRFEPTTYRVWSRCFDQLIWS